MELLVPRVSSWLLSWQYGNTCVCTLTYTAEMPAACLPLVLAYSCSLQRCRTWLSPTKSLCSASADMTCTLRQVFPGAAVYSGGGRGSLPRICAVVPAL